MDMIEEVARANENRCWQIHNPNFKPIEFDRFKAESGDNVFTLTSQQWIKATREFSTIE